MSTSISIKHSGDLGDLCYGMAAMANLGDKIKLYIAAADFTRQRLTPENYAPIVPLALSQSWCESVDEYSGQEASDDDTWRVNLPSHKNLAERQCECLGVSCEVLRKPWLSVPPRKVAKQVVNRTFRYHGRFPREELIPHEAVFIGTKKEHMAFCAEFVPIPWYCTNDFYEAARVIAGAELYLGNQSACFAIAVGLGQNAVLEEFVPSQNCNFSRWRSNIRYSLAWY